MARDGVLHRDPVVREREVAWAHAWSEEFTSVRLVMLAVVFVLAILVAGLVFRPAAAAIAILIESWLGCGLFLQWRAARGVLRASGS